jgi:hypothetical protein
MIGLTMQLTFLSEEPPAKASASPASEKDWLTRAATWRSSILEYLTDSARAGSFGKMSPASCRQTADGILVPSSGAWLNSGMGSLTEFWTLNSCEHADTDGRPPSDGDVCSLWDILEIGDLPQRYYLTAKACSGVLRRAERRAKQLPLLLQQALEHVAQTTIKHKQDT